MPSNKSPGPDKISMRVLKDCLPVILGPLTDIINNSLLTSTFPDVWKEAEVIPLLKEGDHEIASNNRPLSLLPVASKICEKVALNQFSTFLLRNGYLSSHQSGNKKHHSTESLNILVYDIMLEAMDKKMLTALILLDLSKAFDSVSHSILLRKLSSVGASPQTVKWFGSYLTERSQSVRIGSSLSSPRGITHGVPQGAILSPLLFCIYMNHLPLVPLECRLESYVDDSKVFMSFPITNMQTAKQHIEVDLRRVAEWCCDNKLLINPKKTKLLFVGTRQMLQRMPTNLELTFLGKTITPVASAKDLGIIVDSHLSYDCHISNLVSSCMAKLSQINRVKHSFDKETLTLIISALVISKLMYCSTVWSNTSATNIKKLQSVQNFACKIITNTRKYDHVTPSLRQLNWLPIRDLLVYRETVMSYKCMNNLAPSYLCERFVKRSQMHNRSTRNSDMLQIPLFRTATGQRSFYYRCVKIWNDLDESLKQLPSLRIFKKNLKKAMIKKLD